MTISSVKLALLCMILAIDPVPMPPVQMTRLATASSNDRARSKADGHFSALLPRSLKSSCGYLRIGKVSGERSRNGLAGIRLVKGESGGRIYLETKDFSRWRDF